ncbi:hypothetical protein [Aeromicrobium sp. 9AM]|uniref:hypothetical protein n=1 Tax=Aeromicrobium sp. 9AM TaxID=2653126 RepID=UPI0012F0DC72|nr:hypothetical protein [Aeromicrobium sp. 9AM]VXB82551.1 hypothetical protein AERO9AM_21000 [Aeromicrobium sp. 9AM]
MNNTPDQPDTATGRDGVHAHEGAEHPTDEARMAEVIADHGYSWSDGLDFLICDCGWTMDAEIGPEEGLAERDPVKAVTDGREVPVVVRHRAHVAYELTAAGFGDVAAANARAEAAEDRTNWAIDQEEQARTALEAVRKLVDTEIADDLAANVRSALGNVRCLDCNLRYDERQDYGCLQDGRGHDGFTDEMMAEAAAEATAQGVEYVTLSVATLRGLLPTASSEARS